ncbi:MAG: aldehyde dehydrogenase family protein [Planctomycetota bacterium]|nr:MAG: aldehyde dehydrogenase family protein [Planctomycetota bacterium]
MVRSLEQFIGGRFQAPASGQYLVNLAPATGKPLSQVPRGGGEDVNAAVSAAQEAFDGPWRQWSVEQRAALLDRIADSLQQRADDLAALESADTGKPLALAAKIDIPRAVANFRFFATAVRQFGSDCFPMEGALNYTHRSALGPVALISPWNLPLYLLSWKVAPALAMGNTVVAKPSEMTPMTADALASVFEAADAPPGIFNLIHGLGGEAGQALVEHPDIKAVSFTGGTATGSRVAATAAPQFKKLSLELGGKNPTLVFADCDFEATVNGAVRAAFTNQGQICLCGSRLLVEASLYPRFVEAFVAKVKQLKLGDPEHPETQLGALISAEHREKVESYLALARQEGGEILCGGQRPTLPEPWDQGFFLQPTVIAGLSPSCRTATEEIFGPVVSLHPFETEEEALAIANGVPYGLSASLWTGDVTRAHRLSQALECGLVWVNTWLLRDLRVPFGGVKASGVGREGGRYSLEFFSESKNVCIQWNPNPASPKASS